MQESPAVDRKLGACRTGVRVVIVIFTISSLVHLAIGYALAIYLHGLWPPRARSSSEPSRENGATYPAVSPNLTETPPAMPAVATTENVVKDEQASEPGSKDVDLQRTETEQDLLAGIEEFRNQLARLRTQRLPDDLSDPASLMADV